MSDKNLHKPGEQWNQEMEKWHKEVLEKSLENSPETNLPPKMPHTVERKRVYFPPGPEIAEDSRKKDTESLVSGYQENLGFPGSYPFTRGIYPTMYRSRFWTMRQYAGFASARQSNERYRYLLAQGQTGLSVAFDLPTQMGYDSDHDLAYGEVGKVGVAIDTLEDMRTLTEGLPLNEISTSMTINATASILLAFYIAIAQERGISAKALRGTVQNDILKEYIARGTYIYPPGPSLRLITDVMDYCAKEVPKWNTISISGYHIREAGSTAIQEVAFTLANAITYVEAAKNRGLNIEKMACRLSFFFNVHNDLLEEVAKFRAARRLWARILKERFDIQDSRAQMLRFHAQTAGSTLTAQQPNNNVVRVSLQALAAVLGGAQSLHTNSMDEALGLPTQEAVTLALRTQQMIAHESGVCSSVDPLGGSYLVEELTSAIEEKVQTYIERIDQMGGMIRAIEQGFPQREIQNSAYEMQKQIEEKKRIIVGVNEFQDEVDADAGVEILKIDEAIEKDQVKHLKAFKQKRSARAVQKSLAEIRARAEGEANLMPAIVEAVKNQVSLGEISDTLREVFGIYHEVQVI